MWRDLPPVGQRVVAAAAAPPVEPAGCTALYVQSGTAALALALSLAAARRPDVAHPRVILPGYACPDLLSASLHAGLEPVLVDVGADDPGYDLNALDTVLASDVGVSVVAVVAVNFLGVGERLEALRERTDAIDAWLVEDNAQWFPEGDGRGVGQARVLSFGRGKPVNLLGGGALWLQEPLEAGLALPPLAASAGRGLALKRRLLNVLLNPWLYPLLSRNPLLSVGATHFKPLREVTALDGERQAALAANAQAWLQRSRWREQALSEGLTAVAGLTPLPRVLPERAGRLLRYPVLCRDRARRDAALLRLRRQGLGASAMYRCPLPEVAGVHQAWPGSVAFRGALPGAQALAERLLTLPVHDGVRAGDIERMRDVLAAHGR